MNKTKRIISAVIAVCMIFSLMPVQFALASDENPDAYAVYSEDGNIPADYKGHVWELKEAPDEETKYDYTLTVSEYNMDAAVLYATALKFNNTVVNLVDDKGNAFAGRGSTPKDFVTYAKPNSKMTSNSANEAYTWIEEGMVFNNTATTSLDIVKQDDYYNILLDLGVQQVAVKDQYFTAADWNTTVGGAVYGQEIDGIHYMANNYKFPPNEKCDLFTLKFKKVGSAKIDENTFKLAYSTVNKLNGGGGRSSKTENGINSTLYVDEGVLLIGFPEPTNNKTVTFKGVSGDSTARAALNADIKLYNNVDDRTNKENEVATATNNGDGTYTATVDAGATGRTYYYSVTVPGYNVEMGNVRVPSDANAEVEAITLTPTSANEYDVVVTVKDADTETALDGATVEYLGKTATTAPDGSYGNRAVIKMPAGSQTVKAKMTGYTDSADTPVTVEENNANKVDISLVPERANVTFPPITGVATSDSKVLVERISTNDTNQWGKEKEYTGVNTAELPKNTTYKVTFSAPKHLSKTMYLQIDGNGVSKFYTTDPTSGSGTEFTNAEVELDPLDDPYYYVEVKANPGDSTTYTAKVTLNNVEAENGTFGLQYDNKVFSLEKFEIATGIKNENVMLPSATESMLTRSDDTTAVTGYHAFSWIVDGLDSDGNQATTSLAQDIATYTFKLKENKDAKDITSAAFTVMPFDKTSAGLDFIQSGKDLEESREYLDYLWRYVDANNDTPLARRLHKDKATLNGFHQVYVAPFDGNYPDDAVIGAPNYNSIMTDVRTQFDFTAERGALQFVVTDEDNIALDDATVEIYEKGGSDPIATIKTDETGIVTYPVDGDKDYEYVVSLPGYWDVPEEGKNPASVKDKETTVEYITMHQKIYHEPNLEVDASVTNGAHATLSGDEVAYNGKEFFFDITAELGWTITDAVFEVIVKDENGVDQTYTVTSGDVSTKDGMYVLAPEKIVGLPLDPPQIDAEHGYKSDDIRIKLVSATIEESNEEYTVTATAGANGKVTYTADTSAGEFAPPATATGSKVTLTPIKPAANKTGTFTFTADPQHWVEKVIINGVLFDYKADKMETFTYSFGEVTMDSDIVVTFWDGEHETNDAVVTLVVGPSGSVDVTNPTAGAEQGITNTRRTYVFPEADLATNNTLAFTTDKTPVRVEKSADGINKETLNPSSANNYSVQVNAQDNIVVYVTFDDSTVYVTSYVKEGLGMIDPAGVLIKKKHDTVTVNMTAETNDPTGKQWSVSAVDVDGTEIKNPGPDDNTFEYTIVSIMNDTSIGAIFTESTYNVKGYVDLSQNSNLTGADVQTFAFVTCTRQEDGKVIDTIRTTTDRKDAYFTAELPKGTWDVTVKKSGYINYTITGFIVEGTKKDVIFGEPSGGGTVKKITPFIGNTNGSGRTVSFADVGVVGNGLRKGVTGTILQRADVDDDGEVKADSDMMYIKANYGQRSVTQTYTEFMDSTITPNTPITP